MGKILLSISLYNGVSSFPVASIQKENFTFFRFHFWDVLGVKWFNNRRTHSDYVSLFLVFNLKILFFCRFSHAITGDRSSKTLIISPYFPMSFFRCFLYTSNWPMKCSIMGAVQVFAWFSMHSTYLRSLMTGST